MDDLAVYYGRTADGKIDTLHLGICEAKERLESLERDIEAIKQTQAAIHHQLLAQGMMLSNIEALIKSLRARAIP